MGAVFLRVIMEIGVFPRRESLQFIQIGFGKPYIPYDLKQPVEFSLPSRIRRRVVTRGYVAFTSRQKGFQTIPIRHFDQFAQSTYKLFSCVGLWNARCWIPVYVRTAWLSSRAPLDHRTN